MNEEALYIGAEVNTLIHMGAIAPGLVDPTTGAPSGDIALPLASTLGFYVMTGSPTDTLDSVDPKNNYSINSWGCRDTEYVGQVDIIAAGCSQTFGQGVPVESRWSSVLGELLGMSVATLAIPGWSTQSAINAVMSYIKKFGKPKIVVLYLPDFFRYDFMATEDGLVASRDYSRGGNNIPFYLEKGTALDIDKRPNYSKRPHAASDIYSPENSHLLSGQALRFFIEYCREAGIKLKYATWHSGLAEYIKFVKRADIILGSNDDPRMVKPEIDLTNYVDMNMFYPHGIPMLAKTTEYLESLTCHQDLKSRYGPYFNWGTDRDKHIGVHAHAHIAENFLAVLETE